MVAYDVDSDAKSDVLQVQSGSSDHGSGNGSHCGSRRNSCVGGNHHTRTHRNHSSSSNSNNNKLLSSSRYTTNTDANDYEEADNDDDFESRSFRTMSRLMLLDNSTKRSDSGTMNAVDKNHCVVTQHRSVGSPGTAGRRLSSNHPTKTMMTTTTMSNEQQQHQNQHQQQQDVYETGQWGTISRRDKICFIMTLTLLVLGIALAFVFVSTTSSSSTSTSNSSGSGSNIDFSNNSPTATTTTTTPMNPSMPSSNVGGGNGSNGVNGGDGSGTDSGDGLDGTSIGVNHNSNDDIIHYTASDQYNALRNSIQMIAPESIASEILLHIPENFNEFNTARPDPADTTTPVEDGTTAVTLDIYQRAMIWFLYNDPVTIKFESELVSRYVLIVTYLYNGGAAWQDSTNWMTSYHICLWYGIRCKSSSSSSLKTTTGSGINTAGNGNHDVMEVDMSNNGVTGPIHAAYTLLWNCTSILFHSNQLTGTIPGSVFGNMISLEYLYLQNNLLVGTIPDTLTISSSISTLFVQGNPNLTGTWPIEFCPSPNSGSDNAVNQNNQTTGNDGSIDSTGSALRPIYSYGMDCNEIQCACCDPSLHCFN